MHFFLMNFNLFINDSVVLLTFHIFLHIDTHFLSLSLSLSLIHHLPHPTPPLSLPHTQNSTISHALSHSLSHPHPTSIPHTTTNKVEQNGAVPFFSRASSLCSLHCLTFQVIFHHALHRKLFLCDFITSLPCLERWCECGVARSIGGG